MNDPIEPVFTDEEDGMEYVGEKMSNIGLFLPLALTESWEVNTRLGWAVRGAVRISATAVWLFTVGWILMLAGLCINMAAESYNKEFQ
jgi:hypothetical protein